MEKLSNIRKLLEKHYIPVTETGCWLWTGGLSHNGYGQLKLYKKTERAHRLSWELRNGQIPDGMIICHRCDTPSCVNPDHLFLGTYETNAKDRERKGRGFESNVTHCPQGHEYTPENTAIRYLGKRKCRECERTQALARYYKNHAAIRARRKELYNERTK